MDRPGIDQPVGSANLGDIYLPSSSTTTLVVTQDPAPTYPDSYPLPTEFWTRPIYAENPFWWKISSNWLGTGSAVNSAVSAGTITGISMSSLVQRFPGDAVGSLTSHVMWTKPIQSGGVVGGNNFEIQGDTYFEGSAYSQRYTNPIIVNGKLYYNPPLSFRGSNAGPTTCVDLRTGQVLWQRTDVPVINFALIWDLQNGNQHGVYPALLCTSNFARVFRCRHRRPTIQRYRRSYRYNSTGSNGRTTKICTIELRHNCQSKLELSLMELNPAMVRNLLPPRHNPDR